MKSRLCALETKSPPFFPPQHLNAAQVQTGRLVSVVTRSGGGVPLMKSAGGNNNRGGGVVAAQTWRPCVARYAQT